MAIYSVFLMGVPNCLCLGASTQILSTTLVDMDSGWLAMVVAPLNSIAGLIGILLVGMQILYRRMVR